jgi:hypothetical protein
MGEASLGHHAAACRPPRLVMVIRQAGGFLRSVRSRARGATCARSSRRQRRSWTSCAAVAPGTTPTRTSCAPVSAARCARLDPEPGTAGRERLRSSGRRAGCALRPLPLPLEGGGGGWPASAPWVTAGPGNGISGGRSAAGPDFTRYTETSSHPERHRSERRRAAVGWPRARRWTRRDHGSRLSGLPGVRAAQAGGACRRARFVLVRVGGARADAAAGVVARVRVPLSGSALPHRLREQVGADGRSADAPDG